MLSTQHLQGFDMYQGHLNDGSSIQAHSAGGLYPYVIYAQGSDALTYGVIVPGQSGYIVGTYDEAVAHASALKDGITVRTNGQNFLSGQVVRVSGQGWGDAKGVIQQLELPAYRATKTAGFRALIQRFGELRATWVPLTSLTIVQ